MRRILLLATVAVMMVVMMAAAGPAMADRFPEGPGQPLASGDFDHPRGSIVVHMDDGACVSHFGGGQSGGRFSGPGCNL
jgi:hypothetical protein